MINYIKAAMSDIVEASTHQYVDIPTRLSTLKSVQEHTKYFVDDAILVIEPHNITRDSAIDTLDGMTRMNGMTAI